MLGATAVNKTKKAPGLRSLHLAYLPDKLCLPNPRAVLLTSSTAAWALNPHLTLAYGDPALDSLSNRSLKDILLP